MGKPVGTYLTIEAPNMAVPDEDYHRKFQKAGRGYQRTRTGTKGGSICPRGRAWKPRGDTGCTRTLCGRSSACHTAHRKRIWEICDGKRSSISCQCCSARGYGADWNGDAGDCEGVVEETEPDFVVAIDALAARNSKRLNRTIQITDTGICPGSGVGNHRLALNSETLGVKVIGIGVPTVVDAVTIVNDTMENFIVALESSELLKSVGRRCAVTTRQRSRN